MTRPSRLLWCYPPSWRARYGEDLAAYLDDAYPGHLPVRAAASLVAGGLRERVRSARLLNAAAPAGDRLRGGVLTVLVAWAAFVVAGSSFAKLSEHFDSPLSDRTRTIPDLAFTALQAVATLCGLAVVAGLVLAVPALLRFLARGGWVVIRRYVAQAAIASVLTAGMTVVVVVWAHQLNGAQRNGGSPGYAAAFVVWAGLLVLAIALWTGAAIATARRLALSRRVLLAEGALATGVTAGMLVMVAAAATWWAAMASSAPAFFDASATGPTSPWNLQLVGTLALMVVALASASAGVARIARAALAVLAR